MNKYTKHVLLPAMAPALIVGLYFTPVSLIDCVNRGQMTAAVVLVSAIAVFVTVAMAIHLQLKNDLSSQWWVISTLILTLPLVLVLGPLS